MFYQLEIDIDPGYVHLPKGSGESLGHQCCLMGCELGQCPSLHRSGKIDNHFSTKDNSWFTSRVETSQLGRGRFHFFLGGPLNGQLLWGSCGTPHNAF